MANMNSATPVTDKLNVFKSAASGKLYACKASDNSFIGMLAADFDKTKPAFIINVSDVETGNTWNFIGNYTQKEVEFTIG